MTSHPIPPELQQSLVAEHDTAAALRQIFGPMQHLLRPYVQQLASRLIDSETTPTVWTLHRIANGAGFLQPASSTPVSTLRYRDRSRDLQRDLPANVVGLILTLKALQALADQPLPMFGRAQMAQRFQQLHDFAMHSPNWDDIFDAIV